MKHQILIVDDEAGYATVVKKLIVNEEREIFIASTAKESRKILKKHNINIMLLDIMLPDAEGLDFFEEFKDFYPDMLVIIMTASRSIPQVIRAIQLGAYHYLSKPFNKEELENVISNGLETIELKKRLIQLEAEKGGLNKPFLIGNSKQVSEINEYVEKLKEVPFSILLITGDTGTGKSNLAKYIHWRYFNHMDNFVHISCADIQPNLLETELFGYEKGAFTDAKKSKKGLFELASNGTLFLDEIDSITPELQKKLLYFLDNKSIRRVGSTKELQVDLRLIAATNANLEELVEQKKFRKDLYYRLKVMQYYLTPLRERVEDIPSLANYFKDIFNMTFSKNIAKITEKGISKLQSYDWPGNIRELKNVIESAIIFCDSSCLDAKDFDIQKFKKTKRGKAKFHLPITLDEVIPYDDMGSLYIRQVLRLTGNNKSKAAELLEISRTTLRSKLDA